MDDAFAAADQFLLNQARLLERRLFATCFLGQPAARVTDALRGYQNDGGGFGHALEPDKRCPASLPGHCHEHDPAIRRPRSTRRSRPN